jgi:hypothetical protein
MNKFFATFALLISALCFAQAQDGYIKHQKDSEYRNKTIKVLKGEIFPFINASKQGKINVIIGSDTITDIEKTSKSFETFTPTTSYGSQKDDFLQTKSGGIVWVNAKNISATDTVTLISESGKQITQLITQREAQVSLSDLGKTCRLIISNSPTIFYSTDKLKQFTEPEPVQETDNTETPKEEKTETGWAWWYYALIVLGVCGLGFGIWKYIKNTMKPHSNEVVFKGGSLTEFADQYGGLDKLSSLNKGIIPTKSEWNKLKNNESAKADKVKGLKGKRIIIQAEDETSFGFQDNNYKTNVEQSHTKEWESPKETYVQPTNFGNNNELSGQLQQMERTLIYEIQRINSGNNNQNELNKLRNEKTELENKLRGLDSTLKQLQTDKSNLESNLQSANIEKNQIQTEIKNLKEKVISVDFLKGYSDSVFSYLKFCQQVSADAYNCFNKISHQNLKQAFAAGHLLMKFQTSVNSIPIGNWLQTVQDIKDTGATTNKQLIRSFSQIQNDSEKQKEFQRLLFTEVLTKYSSNILILAEAFKNLTRFQVSPELANDIQNTFGKHVTEIVSKAKAAGLEIKYVSLFKNFEEYLGQIESVDKERTLAYREVSGLQKNEIAEIDSYGVKTNFEDSKTYVILA